MPPCIQLETKWSMEYGMPSTHSMVGLAVPTSILYYTATRYQVINKGRNFIFQQKPNIVFFTDLPQIPVVWWTVLAVVWIVLVSTSRLYLGVHSIAVRG